MKTFLVTVNHGDSYKVEGEDVMSVLETAMGEHGQYARIEVELVEDALENGTPV